MNSSQRLAESFETALRHGDGRAIAVELARTMWWCASIFIPPSSPARFAATRWPSWSRVFSRSTARWAPAPSATGLGAISSSSTRSASSRFRSCPRVRRDPRLGPAQPVLLPAAAKSRQARGLRRRQALRQAPRARAEPDPRRLGRRENSIHLLVRPRQADGARACVRGDHSKPRRRYRETDSVMVREELAKYLNNKPCPECGGTRLRREARFVKVGEGGYARSDLRGFRAATQGDDGVLPGVEARRLESRNRRPHRQGNREPAAVPEQRRPRLPGARPPRPKRSRAASRSASGLPRRSGRV